MACVQLLEVQIDLGRDILDDEIHLIREGNAAPAQVVDRVELLANL